MRICVYANIKSVLYKRTLNFLKMGKTCFIALSFGSSSVYRKYGKSNNAIAKVASSAKYPILAQWEIANLLSTEHGKKVALCVKEKPGEYLDTIAVLVAAKKFMGKNDLTDAIFIAHQDHIPRIRENAKETLDDLKANDMNGATRIIAYTARSKGSNTNWYIKISLSHREKEIWEDLAGRLTTTANFQ